MLPNPKPPGHFPTPKSFLIENSDGEVVAERNTFQGANKVVLELGPEEYRIVKLK